MADDTKVWSVAQAKARLSEVIDRALEQGPQTITKNGRPAVVVAPARSRPNAAEQSARKPPGPGPAWRRRRLAGGD